MSSVKDEVKLSKLSCFKIHPEIVRFGGEPTSVRNLADGSLCIQVSSAVHSRRLMACKVFCGVPCEAKPHATLNYSKGVITCWDLRDESDHDILNYLKKQGQGVIDVRRIIQNRNGESIKTNALILTFENCKIPSEIKVAYHRVKVRQYIPNPMRCFKCQKYGHVTKFCKGKSVCSLCSSSEHSDKECRSSVRHCTNCSGDHPSFSRSCPKYLEEKEIIALKIRNNITFNEARKAYRAAHSTKSTYASVAASGQKSYAAVVRSQPTSAALSHTPSEAELKTLARKMGYAIVPLAPSTNLGAKKSSSTDRSSSHSSQSSCSRSSSSSSTRVNVHISPKGSGRRPISSPKIRLDLGAKKAISAYNVNKFSVLSSSQGAAPDTNNTSSRPHLHTRDSSAPPELGKESKRLESPSPRRSRLENPSPPKPKPLPDNKTRAGTSKKDRTSRRKNK